MKKVKEVLSDEFDDLIKTLKFPNKFWNILDKVIYRSEQEAYIKGLQRAVEFCNYYDYSIREVKKKIKIEIKNSEERLNNE